MPTFRNQEHLYEILDAFFTRVAEREDVAGGLLAGEIVLRFRYTEPEGVVTIDLREPPLTWVFDDESEAADVEMIQSADTAHRFWLGDLNVPTAIATRKVVSRGPVAKALKLLPAVKPTFGLYAATLRDLGYEELLPTESETKRRPIERTKTLLARLFRRLRPTVPIDASILNAHLIPLAAEAAPDKIPFRESALPTDEDALKVEMLRRMVLIRAFEEKLSTSNQRGEIPTEAIHLSIGQEATAVGVCFAMGDDDYIATTHRGHGHMLAKGVDLQGMMSEMLAKGEGLCKGKGGSMHVTDASVGAIGANGIVGASPLMAIGAAQASLLRGTKQAAVAFMGDGATNQGMFHEAVNFAAVFDLPVVFVIENNLYGEFTPLEKHCRVPRLSDRAAAYGISGETVDGNDVWAVHDSARRALEKARTGGGPTLLECTTYRWHGHMEGEDVPYRPIEEIERWKEKCPIIGWRRALLSEGLIGEEDAAEMETAVSKAVEDAFQHAMDEPEPPLSELTTDVFSTDPEYLYEPTPTIRTDREITYSQALVDALEEEMRRDASVYLIGEDVSTGGYFAVTAGLIDEFGPQRVVDTPISEYAIVGSAVGSAMSGGRPVAEILFSDFLTTCMDPLVNQAAKLRYMSGGQYSLPLVVRTPGGGGLGMAAQHSQSLEALLTGIPGLIVVAPATPYDAKGLLKAAIRSNNPVLFFENKVLYASTGPVPDEDFIVPLGSADVKRRGTDVTVVSIGGALGRVVEAAETLARSEIDVEIVDVRSLVPLDVATIVESIQKTGRLVTVEDGPLFHGFGAEIVARVTETAFSSLKTAPWRVAALDVPIPYCSTLENAVVPDAARIERAIRSCLGS